MSRMVLHWSPRSPYVRRVMVTAHEKGLSEAFDRKRSLVSTFFLAPDDLVADNGLGKIPTLILPDGTAIHDSRVICQYFDDIGTSGPKLYPASGIEKYVALSDESLGVGLTDQLIMLVIERNREPQFRSDDLKKTLIAKCQATMSGMTKRLPALRARPFDIGHLSIGCGIAYADFRAHELDWRKREPDLAKWYDELCERPSFKITTFVDEDSGPKN
jgi:glutathione S-transferase